MNKSETNKLVDDYLRNECKNEKKYFKLQQKIKPIVIDIMQSFIILLIVFYVLFK